MNKIEIFIRNNPPPAVVINEDIFIRSFKNEECTVFMNYNYISGMMSFTDGTASIESCIAGYREAKNLKELRKARNDMTEWKKQHAEAMRWPYNTDPFPI